MCELGRATLVRSCKCVKGRAESKVRAHVACEAFIIGLTMMRMDGSLMCLIEHWEENECPETEYSTI